MSSDAIKAFAFLDENLPTWINDLEEIREQIAKKQEEWRKLEESLNLTPKKAVSGSLESLKLQTTVNPLTDSTLINVRSTAADRLPISPPDSGRVQLSTNRRRQESICSGTFSGPPKMKTKVMTVIYYDSQIQSAFEKLVRNIGIGRNHLRKGKMSARMEALSSMTSNREGGDDSNDEELDITALVKMSYRNGRTPPSLRSQGSRGALRGFDDGTGSVAAYDQADKCLERAQAQCERGAHQHLRDGDGTEELNICKKQFQEVIISAKKELDKNRQKVEKEQVKLIEKEMKKLDKEQPVTRKPEPIKIVKEEPSTIISTEPQRPSSSAGEGQRTTTTVLRRSLSRRKSAQQFHLPRSASPDRLLFETISLPPSPPPAVPAVPALDTLPVLQKSHFYNPPPPRPRPVSKIDMGSIEVDDNDEEDEGFNMESLKAARFVPRRTRVMV